MAHNTMTDAQSKNRSDNTARYETAVTDLAAIEDFLFFRSQSARSREALARKRRREKEGDGERLEKFLHAPDIAEEPFLRHRASKYPMSKTVPTGFTDMSIKK